MVRLYSKIPNNFASLILNDPFWLVLLPFCCHWNSFCSVNLPMDETSNQIMSSLVLLLRKSGTFADIVVDCLISLTTHPTFRFLMRFVNLPFDGITLKFFLLSCTYHTVSHFRVPFLTIRISCNSLLP